MEEFAKKYLENNYCKKYNDGVMMINYGKCDKCPLYCYCDNSRKMFSLYIKAFIDGYNSR